MKLTIAWNVWNNYLDTALGSEIVRLENERQCFFEALHLISQGGFPDLPTPEQSQYLDGHFTVAYPEVPLIQLHAKFKGVFRVIEGIKKAYEYASAHGDDFALVTNGDAWPLSLQKLHAVLRDPAVQRAAVSMRLGSLTGLTINFGNRVPLFDDHFIILNVAKCKKLGVFNYDHSARFFQPHFGHIGGIHYILCCFVDQRVPEGLFHIYTDVADTVNHYGDWMGWNLLPWQYQLSTGFLHANCAQVPTLNALRAAFLHDLGFTRYPLTRRYWEETGPRASAFTRRRGVLVYKKPFRRFAAESLYWLTYRGYTALMRPRFAKEYARMDPTDHHVSTLTFFDQYRHIRPYRLTQ